jgi:hypothetical protein
MNRTYLVQMPRAEARYLAGVGVGWPESPEARCVHAMREWMNGIRRRKSRYVPVQKVLDDLDPLLGQVPVAERPTQGPFASRGGGAPPPGRVEYLGGGAVRLDDAAISALTELREGEDFRVTITEAGPVFTVGTDCYLAHAEEPDSKA